jgi:putative membrane protein
MRAGLAAYATNVTPLDPTATPEPKANEGTVLARERTSLALERSFLATERTLMAWLRTSLSMISFGFTLAKIFKAIGDKRSAPVVGTFGSIWTPEAVGRTMVFIGTGALVCAVIQHRRRVAALRAQGLVAQWNLALHVALLVAALGVFALLTLFLGH